MMNKTLLSPPCLALLLVLGCSSRTEGDPKTKTSEAPKTKAAQTKPAETPATAPAPATNTASAPVTGEKEPESMAIFYMGYGDHLVPLACYDATKKSILKGSACLEVVPEGSAIAFPGGKTAKITGRAKHLCEPSGDEAPAFASEGRPPDVFKPFSVWPKSALDSFHVLPEPLDDEGAKALPEPERARLEKAVRAQKPGIKEGLILKQDVSLDIDGDGKEDRLYSVVIPPAGGGDMFAGYQFSGLLYANGQSPENVVTLETSGLETFIVDGYTDLDGDKKLELWLSVDYYEGAADSIVQVKDGKLELLGAWGCGA